MEFLKLQLILSWFIEYVVVSLRMLQVAEHDNLIVEGTNGISKEEV